MHNNNNINDSSDDDTKLQSDNLDQVIYRGEGNSSIVIALKLQAKVIRLLKKDGKIMKSSQDHHVSQHPMRNIKFIHRIMKPLTDPFLSGATELVHLKSDFINLLSKKVEVERPLHRLDKTLHLDDQYALVMDDLCTLPTQLTRLLGSQDLCGPTISIEIKPKQGFLPIHRLMMKSSTNDQLASSLKDSCLYGLTQNLKLARGRIQETSQYCPVNLFSGCPIKMRNALEGLMRNPQNNLRIFKDLVIAYDESNQLKLSNVFEDFFQYQEEISPAHLRCTYKPHDINQERLIELLIQCLLNEHIDRNSDLDSIKKDNENSFSINEGCYQHSSSVRCRRCDIYHPSKKHKSDPHICATHKLPSSCVLSSVLRAQKLDTVGAHDANFMLDWLIEDAKNRMTDVDILEELSTPHMPYGFGSAYQLPQESKQQYYFRKVWEFLVSLTAKDCSIIITIRRVTQGKYESIVGHLPEMKRHLLKENRTGIYHMFTVGIADLDQKMPLKIPRICDNLNLILHQLLSEQHKKESSNSSPLQKNHKIPVGPS